jgi:hypothetical protein
LATGRWKRLASAIDDDNFEDPGFLSGVKLQATIGQPLDEATGHKW